MRFFHPILVLFLLLPIMGRAQTVSKTKSSGTKSSSTKALSWLSYEVIENGDTINKTDSKHRKQGAWMIFHEARMGEPALLEFGFYRDDKKQGMWRQFTRTGKLIAAENYKKGLLDGEAKYYDEGRLQCIGNYYALREDRNGIDTILVEDPVTNIEKPVAIKSETGCIRHGLWTYYDTETGKIAKVVEYQGDNIIYEKDYLSAKDSVAIKKKWKMLPNGAPDERDRVWYFDKNKRPVTFKELHEQAGKIKRL